MSLTKFKGILQIIFLASFVAILYGILSNPEHMWFYNEYFMICFDGWRVAKITFAASAFLLVLVLICTKYVTLEPEITKSSVNLISVYNGQQFKADANFGFLGGYLMIDNFNIYRYYYKTANGYIDQGITPVESSHITYADEAPYLEIIETRRTEEARFWVLKGARETKTTVEYIYHIPEGSVVTNYELH